MSYSIAYTIDAKVDFRRLDVLLQEEVLDAVDLLAAQPDLLPSRNSGGFVVYDFVCEIAGVQHYVFLTLRVLHALRQFEITEIGHFSKPIVP